MAGPAHPTPDERQAVSLREWKQALAAENFAPEQSYAVQQEIFAFLHRCKVHHTGASIMLAKQYLTAVERQGRTQARQALRWSFRSARRTDGRRQSAEDGGRTTEDGRRRADRKPETGTRKPEIGDRKLEGRELPGLWLSGFRAKIPR